MKPEHLLIAAFFVQNLEEAIWLPDWARMQLLVMQTPEPRVFVLALAVLTVLVGFLLAEGARHPGRGLWSWVVAIIAGGLLVNALSHVTISLATGSVMPGALSGVVAMAPASALVIVRRVRSGALALPAAAVATAAGVALTPPLTLGLFTLARWAVG
jgi:hypothetical protein